MEIKLLDLTIIGDHRGSLISLESNRSIPFDIRRVYYIFDTKENVRRGLHAHRDLKQILICVNGSCKVLLDDGKHKREINLDTPAKGLYIESMIWREMYEFSSNCVLMVLADDFYREEDYIRDYREFKLLLKND